MEEDATESHRRRSRSRLAPLIMLDCSSRWETTFQDMAARDADGKARRKVPNHKEKTLLMDTRADPMMRAKEMRMGRK